MAELTINTAPAIPTWEHQVSRALPGTRDETTHALAPSTLAEKTAITDEEQKLLDEQKRIEEQHRLATQAENETKAATAAQMAEASAQLAADREKAMAASETQIDEWRTRMRAANDAYAAAPLPSLFHKGDTGRNVLKGVGLLLGAIGDARMTTATMLAGHAPSGHSAVDDIIAADFAQQREAIDKLKDNAVMAASGLKDAKEGRQLLLANLDVKQAAVYDRIAKLGASRLGAVAAGGAPGQPGTDAATIGKDSNIAAWTEKALKKRADAVVPLTNAITAKFGGTVEDTTRAPTQAAGGGGVEADKNAANFELFNNHTQWMAKEMANLTPADVEGINRAKSQETLLQGSNLAGAAAGTLGVDPQQGLSTRAKEWLDRSSRAADAIGRLKSGGAVNGGEDTRFSRWSNPLVSDIADPKNMERLARNMLGDAASIGKFVARAPRNTVTVSPDAAPAVAAPTVKPPTAAPPAQEDDRARAVRLLRVRPTLPGKAELIKKFNITPAELGAP